MKGVRPLYSLMLLLATISTLQCGPIEVIYTGDSCDCPKSLDYMVKVPIPPKHKTYPPSEHGYKLEAPMPPCKAKVTYTFDFTVQEPKTPSPIEQEKWDLFAKIDRITEHKKDCIAEEGSTHKCSCHRCKASRRYVSPIAMAYKTSRLHPNSLSKTQLPEARTIAWAAFIKPIERPFVTQLKSRRRRDISRFFLNKRKRQMKKQASSSNSRSKQYNRKLRAPATTMKPKVRFLKDFNKFSNLMNLGSLRNKRDIKGEYDLIEKERDELDLTLPEIIQFMPETLDPNFKRGRCQFGDCPKQQQHKQEEQEESNITSKNQATQKVDEGNTLVSVEKDSETQGDDDANAEQGNGDYKNEINSVHAKRNADEYEYNPNPMHQYNVPVSSALPYGPGYHPLPGYAPMYNAPHILPSPIIAVPYGSHPAGQHYPYQMPHSMVDPRTVYPPVYAPLPLPPPPPSAYMRTAYYSAPPPLPPPPPPPTSSAYSHEYQLDSIIRDIVNQHPDFIEGQPDGEDSKDEQKQANKSLFKTLLSGKWQRFVIDDYYGSPKYRREALTEQPSTE